MGIEGDIKGYFDNIDHKILMSIISKRIKDPIILKLIKTGLKSRVFDDKVIFTPEVGTPQGGILSPLLLNIYLDTLDKSMDKIHTEYKGTTKSTSRRKNPVYDKLMRSGQKKLVYSMKCPRNIIDENYREVKYVRYADNFLIGITGSRKLATEIKGKVRELLKTELNLTLSEEKTHITHVSRGVSFLGHTFGRNTYVIKQKYGRKIVNRKITIPTLYVNMNNVIERLKEKGFCDGSGNPIPCFKFLRYPQSETNMKANSIIRGLC